MLFPYAGYREFEFEDLASTQEAGVDFVPMEAHEHLKGIGRPASNGDRACAAEGGVPSADRGVSSGPGDGREALGRP
ncbi:MAG: hypothetical protein M3P49_17685 [Actinomycetota bacterium]|nr:hypothetical protein [Actinomycetota bacterium]